MTLISVKPDKSAKWEQTVTLLSRHLPWILPAIGSFVVLGLAMPFLLGAQSRAWDDVFHQSLQSQVAEALADGRSPLALLTSHFGIPGFQYYQALHALTAGFLQWITGLPALLIHNWAVTLLFASTPWTFRYLLLKIGLPPMAAGASGLLYIGSVAGMGNSFEAYYELGVASQAMGSAVLPLALGKLVQVCKEGTGVLAAATLFSILIPAHAMFTIYGFIAAVFILVFFARNRRVFLYLTAIGVLILSMTAWWLVPFLENRVEHKAPSDIVTRPDRAVWFAGHSGSSLGRALVSGRTFDGGRRDGSVDEKLDVKLNMTTTRKVRFPYYTLLVALGSVLALIGFRSPANRFLCTGLAVGLLLILGFDDFPFLYHVPFLNQLQAFRVGYFIELFGIALAGIGITAVFSFLHSFAARANGRVWPKRIVDMLVLCALVFFVVDTARIISPYLNRWKVRHFDEVDEILKKADKSDPRQRVLVKFSKPPGRQFRTALEHALEVRGHYRSACNHWTGLSATVNLRICGAIFRPERAPNLARMMGIRFFTVKEKGARALLERNSDGPSAYQLLGTAGKLHIVEDTQAALIHNPPGPRILAIATPAQWYWLTKSWLKRFGRSAGKTNVPWLLRAPGTALSNEAILNAVDAILYLDDRGKTGDIAALRQAATNGKQLLLGMPIDGVAGQVMKPGDPPWHQLLKLPRRNVPIVTMQQMDDGTNPGELTFLTTAEDTTSVFLSMQAHRNWKATVDGKPAATLAGGPDLVSTVVPEGKHTVSFRYERSDIEKRTFALSALVWLMALGGLLIPRAVNILQKMRSSGSY